MFKFLSKLFVVEKPVIVTVTDKLFIVRWSNGKIKRCSIVKAQSKSHAIAKAIRPYRAESCFGITVEQTNDVIRMEEIDNRLKMKYTTP